MHEKSKNFVAFLIMVSAFLFQIGLQTEMRPYSENGIYFQKWSSETMMQTVSIIDLRDAPLETLFNIHIQPPGLDFIRAILVFIWPAQDPINSLLHTDFLLYMLWALLYGLLGCILFLWIEKLTELKFAIIATVIFLLHPATLFYATLLDSTLLTALLVLLMYYLLWKIKNRHAVSVALLVTSILGLFFTRSIFQIPVVIVIGFSLFLFRMPRRKIFLLLIITGGITLLYTVKQYYQFGIFSTSSFTGLNLTRSVGVYDLSDYRDYLKLNDNQGSYERGLPETLIRAEKLNGEPNFNNIQYLKLNQQLIGRYEEYVFETPITQLFLLYRQNLDIYLQPSSKYTEHVIVDRIPWRSFYDQIFSSSWLICLIVLSGIPWLVNVIKNRNYLASTSLFFCRHYTSF